MYIKILINDIHSLAPLMRFSGKRGHSLWWATLHVIWVWVFQRSCCIVSWVWGCHVGWDHQHCLKRRLLGKNTCTSEFLWVIARQRHVPWSSLSNGRRSRPNRHSSIALSYRRRSGLKRHSPVAMTREWCPRPTECKGILVCPTGLALR